MGEGKDLENERIDISSFLAIKKCEVVLKDLSVLIGPQASGKSIIAKLVYYCRYYMKDAFTEFAVSSDDKRSFNRTKVDEFYELFPGADAPDHRFAIKYSNGDFDMFLSKNKGNRTLRITLGEGFEKRLSRARRDYTAYVSNRKDSSNRYYDDGWFSFIRNNETYSGFYANLPRVLHIPATRAFFSTVKKNFFTFLSESKIIDPLMVQFGRFLEFAKSEYTGEGPFRLNSQKPKRSKELEDVISGEFVREKEEDIIRTEWGRVSLQSSSSGQQEALPLVLALLQYPKERWSNDLIIIEEPEAHLFPSAQKAILEMIVRVVADTNCKVLITTHSPYILACINNKLHQPIQPNSQRLIEAGCYFIEKGGATDMYDYEDQLIDMSRLDAVSDEIAREFIEATSGGKD